MKVRWMHGSLRLRISPTECTQLRDGTSIVETADFPGGWTVEVRSGTASQLFSKKPGVVTVVFEKNTLQTLAEPLVEGIYPTIDGTKVILEKDFPCVHPRPSEVTETTETFPAPPGFAERKG